MRRGGAPSAGVVPTMGKKSYGDNDSATEFFRRGFTGCGKTRKRCHSEEQRRRRISHCFENKQSEILRCAQDDSMEGFFRSLFSP
jgi:hypothetical protein